MMVVVNGDELTQRKGVVWVYYAVTDDKLCYNSTMIPKIASFIKFAPFRFTGLHICFNDTAFKPYLNIAVAVLEKRSRIRLRLHFGKLT
jgi:hypothetical protein